MPCDVLVDVTERSVELRAGGVLLSGEIARPRNASALVLFAHGSGSSRKSPRNRHVAGLLHGRGLATLLVDLLTVDESLFDERTALLRFDVARLSARVLDAAEWARRNLDFVNAVGLFGASTGAAAALLAAAERPELVQAVVSRGGRPDLAAGALSRVRAPTLLIVGGNDETVLSLNRTALLEIGASEKRLEIIPGASHLFEEPFALDEVAILAGDFFLRYLRVRREPPRAHDRMSQR